MNIEREEGIASWGDLERPYTLCKMNFTVEVPGEAAPLTPQQVYLALQAASSSQQLSIQTGAQQLQTWETQQGSILVHQEIGTMEHTDTDTECV